MKNFGSPESFYNIVHIQKKTFAAKCATSCTRWQTSWCHESLEIKRYHVLRTSYIKYAGRPLACPSSCWTCLPTYTMPLRTLQLGKLGLCAQPSEHSFHVKFSVSTPSSKHLKVQPSFLVLGSHGDSDFTNCFGVFGGKETTLKVQLSLNNEAQHFGS